MCTHSLTLRILYSPCGDRTPEESKTTCNCRKSSIRRAVLSETDPAQNYLSTAANGSRASKRRRRADSREHTLCMSFLVKVERKECLHSCQELCSPSLWVLRLPASAPQAATGPGGMLDLSLANGCLTLKDNWFLGEMWPAQLWEGGLSFPAHSQIRKGLIRHQNFIPLFIYRKTELDGPRNISCAKAGVLQSSERRQC